MTFFYTKIDETNQWESDFVSSIGSGRIIATYYFTDNILNYLGTELINSNLDEVSLTRIKNELDFFDQGVKSGIQKVSYFNPKPDGKEIPFKCNSANDVIRLWENNRKAFVWDFK